MPANLLIFCAITGALAAAILMNWAIRKNKQFKREGRVWESTAVSTPVYAGLTLLASALGAVEWDRSHDLANEAVGAVLLGMLVGALSAEFGGFAVGDGDDDAGFDGGDGGDGDGDGGE